MTTKSGLVAGLAVVLMAGSVNAALLSRLSGQAYYDDALQITWIANANLAATNTFGVTGICTNNTSPCSGPGTMTWAKANEWIAAMNAANYLGVNNWRLPNIVDTGTPDCDFAYTGTDCGWNVDLSTGEMAHLYYSTLGNVGQYNTSGSPTGCAVAPNYCLTSTGPFSNLQPADFFLNYWYGTSAEEPYQAWVFRMTDGLQDSAGYTLDSLRAWAVRDGDIDVPSPDADSDGWADSVDNCVNISNADQADTDGDLRGNMCDNCRLVANTTGAGAQADSDADGFGNACDGDFGNPAPGNGITNSQDYVIFRGQLGQPSTPPTFNKADINANGSVNSQDYVLFRGLIGLPPGPGAGP